MFMNRTSVQNNTRSDEIKHIYQHGYAYNSHTKYIVDGLKDYYRAYSVCTLCGKISHDVISTNDVNINDVIVVGRLGGCFTPKQKKVSASWRIAEALHSLT